MQDRELIQMAAFKLHETARRLECLARESGSAELRKRFRALAAELVHQEKKLRRAQTATATSAASAASRFAARVRRRAVG
ncbi:MAG: hypothetical protein SF182_22805 [Deltaproteobacteria bacterium]|nr:hypothetical protein [Deltaproteobacteria bacterium]